MWNDEITRSRDVYHEGNLNLNVPIPDKVKKLSQIFIFTLLCGTSKGSMKALKECENKSLTQFLFEYSFQKWTGL